MEYRVEGTGMASPVPGFNSVPYWTLGCSIESSSLIGRTDSLNQEEESLSVANDSFDPKNISGLPEAESLGRLSQAHNSTDLESHNGSNTSNSTNNSGLAKQDKKILSAVKTSGSLNSSYTESSSQDLSTSSSISTDQKLNPAKDVHNREDQVVLGKESFNSYCAGSPSRTLHSSGNSTSTTCFPSGGIQFHPLQRHHLRNFTRDWKLTHSDSGQSSLEYWDYSVELEMLKGPEGNVKYLIQRGFALLWSNYTCRKLKKAQNKCTSQRILHGGEGDIIDTMRHIRSASHQ